MTSPTVPTRQSFHVAGGRGLPVPTTPVEHDRTPRVSYRPPGWDRLPPLDGAPTAPGADRTVDAPAHPEARPRTAAIPGRSLAVRERVLDVAQLCSDYVNGMSLHAVGKAHHLSPTTAREHLVANGVTIRPTGVTVTGQRTFDADTIAAIVAAYQAGAGVKAVARKHNAAQPTVRRILVDAGVTIRGRGGDQAKAATA